MAETCFRKTEETAVRKFPTNTTGRKVYRSFCSIPIKLTEYFIRAPLDISSMMSLSPATSNDYQPSSGKRRRTSFTVNTSVSGRSDVAASPQEPSSTQPPPSSVTVHVPKRGARACTSCRKGKNRCEGEVCYILLWTLDGTLTPSLPWPATPPGPVQNRLLVVAVN